MSSQVGDSQLVVNPPDTHPESKLERNVKEARIIVQELRTEEESKIVVDEVRDYLKDKEKGITPGKCIINDAIYEPIELSPLLFQIMNTPEFHRLKDVHQLGAAHYVYPGANHTRFDHSLGVCYLAGEFAKSLRDQIKKLNKDKVHKEKYLFEDEEVLCVEIAGLCHDLGHGPFSHMFEHKYVLTEECDIKEKRVHEQLSVDIFKRLLVENPKVLAEFVHANLEKKHIRLIGEMIQPPKEVTDRAYPDRVFLYEIVANKRTGIDVDKWDYYARDCHYLGVQQDFQWKRCMLLGQVVKTPDSYKDNKDKTRLMLRIAFRDKELDNIYGMFRTRAVLHQKAYQHKTIKAVEMMIADAIISVHTEPLIQVTAGEPKKSIETAVELTSTEKELKWYLALSDSIVATIKCADDQSGTVNFKKAQELLRRVEKRQLYNCLVTIRIPKLSYAQSQHKDVNTAVELFKNQDRRKVFAKEVFKHYKSARERDNKQLFITEEDLRIEVVRIKLPSEGEDDPLKQVVFYEKESNGENQLPTPYDFDTFLEEKTSKLVVPQAFVEYEIRVYNTSNAEDKHNCDKQELKNATKTTMCDWPSSKSDTETVAGES